MKTKICRWHHSNREAGARVNFLIDDAGYLLRSSWHRQHLTIYDMLLLQSGLLGLRRNAYGTTFNGCRLCCKVLTTVTVTSNFVSIFCYSRIEDSLGGSKLITRTLSSNPTTVNLK